MNPPLPGVTPAIDQWLRSRRSDGPTRQQAIDLLGRMVRIDNTPRPTASASAAAEAQVFDVIKDYLASRSPECQIEHVPIREAIADHPYYTIPYYSTEIADRTRLSARQAVARVYRDRANLFVRWPNPGRPVLAFNAHIDTVAPHVPLRVEGDVVFGRGSVDDKGPCLAMMLAVEWLADIAKRFGIRPACELLLEFVIDEETGGNGSLSASLEKDKGQFNALVVLECTGLMISPANRGVVWYQTTLNLGAEVSAPPGRDLLLEAGAFVIGAFGQCGDRIKSESDHPLFPHRPVQTCHGILGPFGQHPSRVNDYVPLRLTWRGALGDEIRKRVDEAIREYCQRYGDKTQPGVGEKVIPQHVTWSVESEGGALLEVFGIAGHMGSVDRLDGAITKAATIIRKLVDERQRRGGEWSSLCITLKDPPDPQRLVLEGGQGFLPTHKLEDVADRMRAAAREGVEEYLRRVGLSADAIACETRFEKLHNDAFARPVDGPAMNAILAAARDVGIYDGSPIRGWDVSCDARIFAREFPEAEVITFGPGELAQAHSNDEHGDIKDVLAVAETLVRLALAYAH